MARGNEAIQVGIDLASKANQFDMEQDFSNALKYYQASIEKLIPLVEGRSILLYRNADMIIHVEEKHTVRKKALTAEVSTSFYFHHENFLLHRWLYF